MGEKEDKEKRRKKEKRRDNEKRSKEVHEQKKGEKKEEGSEEEGVRKKKGEKAEHEIWLERRTLVTNQSRCQIYFRWRENGLIQLYITFRRKKNLCL